MAKFDPYATLGVAREAPDFVVQAAYRACLKRYHPDQYRGADARQRTESVLESYRLIGEASARACYDRDNPSPGYGSSRVQPSGSENSQSSARPRDTAAAAAPSVTIGRIGTRRKSQSALMAGLAIIGIAAMAGLVNLRSSPPSAARKAEPVSPVAAVAPTPIRPAPTLKPSSPSPATPALPSLDGVLKFAHADKCDMGQAAEAIFKRLVKVNPVTWEGSRGPAVHLPGMAEPIQPTFERRVEKGEGLNVRDNEATLPLDATWHGLRVAKLRFRFMEESSFWEEQVRFREEPAVVRATLNRLGFDLLPVGEWKEVSGAEEVTEGMGVETIPGGAALTCGTSMYY